MPTLTAPLTPDGALVHVLVGLSSSSVQAMRSALRPIPSPVPGKALLDTGAEITCIDSSFVQALSLVLAGTTFANLPAHSGLTLGALFDVQLTIVHPSGNAPDNLTVPNLSSMELSLAHLNFQVLIGRDLLARCQFLYHGPKNDFHLLY
jgi:hypothetical protein